jgi:hypothetical protein
MLYGLLWLIVYDACFVAAYVRNAVATLAGAAAAAGGVLLRAAHAVVVEAAGGVTEAAVQRAT